MTLREPVLPAAPPRARGAAWHQFGLRMGAVAVALAAGFPLAACDEDLIYVGPNEAPSAGAPQPKTPDRLPPGELLEGEEDVFGFAIPKPMKIRAHFGDSVHLAGVVPPGTIEGYISARVNASRVEVAGQRTTYPEVTIKGGDPKRVYQIDVISHGDEVRMVIRDMTPLPAIPGLTEEERWKRAGLKPNGELIDPKRLE